MDHSPNASTLNVPGASIYFERRGSGSLLLLIPGGPQDAGVFAGLASALADDFTVVSYDPRGNSRTVTATPLGDLDLDTQADDAAALIRHLGGGPAYVFGTSGGAQIGLDLAARHPDLVGVLVAHEPPAVMLLNDPAPALAANQRLVQTYRTQGVGAAMGMFFTENGLDGAPSTENLPPEVAETFERIAGNFEYWLAHGLMPLSRYEPHIADLKSGRPRIRIAIGAESEGHPNAAMGAALATRLGVDPLTFPGDHNGFGPHAGAFADALRAAFTDQ